MLKIISICFISFFLINNILKAQSSVEPFYSINTPLIPQKGNFSCWAATLQMLNDSNSSQNDSSAFLTHSEILLNQLLGFTKVEVRQKTQISWEKVKKSLLQNKPLVLMKYYDETNAHVVLIIGYCMLANQKFLIINDPWPVNKGNLIYKNWNGLFESYDQNSTKLNTIRYKNTSLDLEYHEESELIFFTKEDLIDSVQYENQEVLRQIRNGNIKKTMKIILKQMLNEKSPLFDDTKLKLDYDSIVKCSSKSDIETQYRTNLFDNNCYNKINLVEIDRRIPKYTIVFQKIKIAKKSYLRVHSINSF